MAFAELKNRNNSPAQFEALLEPLLTAEFAPARDFAASQLTGRRLRNANHRPYAFEPLRNWRRTLPVRVGPCFGNKSWATGSLGRNYF